MMMMMMMMTMMMMMMMSNPEGHEEAVDYLKKSRHSSHRTSKGRRKLRNWSSHSGNDEDYSVLR
jgi:hypothetical protein